LHSVGAFLHLAPEATGSDIDVAAIIESRHPRDLLLAAIPNAPSRLYRAFERASDRVRSQSFYARLAALLKTPMAAAILDGGYLNEVMFERAEALLAMDPVIVGLRGILTCSEYATDGVATILAFLRGHDAISDEYLRMPKEAGLPALSRRLYSILASMQAPMPSFAVPPPYRILNTVAELRVVGARLENCVGRVGEYGAEHWINLIDGTMTYIVCEETPPFLAAVQQVAPSVCMVAELAGANNDDVAIDDRLKFIAALRAAGLVIVRHSPARALAYIAADYPSLPMRGDEDAAHGGDDIQDDIAA
jgi:hypothetical protein